MGLIRRSLTLVGVILGIGIAACGGGGGGGNGTTPTEPPRRITFTPEGQAGSLSVHLQSDAASSSSTMLVLDVQAQELRNVYGVAFDLSYPASVLRFDSAQEGTFLSEEGSLPTSFQVAEEPEGNLVVGLSRLGDVSGAGGSGTLVRLTFVSTASGSGGFGFANNDVVDPAGRPRGDVSWLAGSVTVVR